MKNRLLFKTTSLLATLLTALSLQARLQWNPALDPARPADWLLHAPLQRATVLAGEDSNELVLYNGQLKRTFRLQPAPECTSFRNLTTDQELIRTVKPEARITIPAEGYTWLVINAPGAPRQTPSTWMGFKRTDTTIAGRSCLVVEPQTALAGRPWIWRTEFFGHEPQGDSMLLTKGFHVVYMDVQNRYGAPHALDLMDSFYRYLTSVWQLNRHTVLEGFSRGGLYAFNWAARHPDEVGCIYVDAPVCDFKSWPAGKGKGQHSETDWQRLQQAYGFKSEEQALAYKGNPIDNLKPLAKAHIPILCVCGDADTVVPMAENIEIVRDRYRRLGGHIEMIAKPGCGHHPHSLKDPTPIVDFILKNNRI